MFVTSTVVGPMPRTAPRVQSCQRFTKKSLILYMFRPGRMCAPVSQESSSLFINASLAANGRYQQRLTQLLGVASMLQRWNTRGQRYPLLHAFKGRY